jgi:antitoxin MazE
MRATVRALGNSSGVLLPKPFLAELNVATGDAMELSLENGRIVLTPVKRAPRAGWAEAAAEIAAAGEDALIWPEFANTDDETLTW